MPEKVEDQKKGYVFQAIMIALTFFVFVASCDPSEYTAMGWLVLFEDDGSPRTEAVTKDDREHSQWYDRNTMWLSEK